MNYKEAVEDFKASERRKKYLRTQEEEMVDEYLKNDLKYVNKSQIQRLCNKYGVPLKEFNKIVDEHKIQNCTQVVKSKTHGIFNCTLEQLEGNLIDYYYG